MESMQEKMPISDIYSLYKGKNVVVLGAAGFIGRWLAFQLGQQGANVFLFVRNKAAAIKIFEKYAVKGKIIEVDLTENASDLIDHFQQINPVIIFNLAGYGVNPKQRDNEIAYKINADLVTIVCEAFSKTKIDAWPGQNIIHAGSALEYGEISGDLSENTQPNPTTLYGKSKLKGTQLLIQYCQQYNLKGMAVRLFTVYGPGELEGRLLPSLIAAADNGILLPLTAGLQKRDFTYIDDVVEGLLRLGASSQPATKPLKSPEIVNLASGKLTTVRNFIEIAAKILSIESNKLQFGMIPVRVEEMQHLPVSTKQLDQLTHWCPSIDITEGICRNLDFMAALK